MSAERTTATHPATPTRLVHETMGTVCSLVVPAGIDAARSAAVQAVFAEMDERFSLYRPTSEASRVSSRQLAFHDSSPQYQSAYWVAHDWSTLTDGAFNPFRFDGTIDLNGVVKALAMERTGDVLDDLTDWCLNVGGDVLARGVAGEGRPWVAGVVDPDDQQRLFTSATLTADLPAIATSTTALRGEHIWRLPGNDAEHRFCQVSVQATDIVTADVVSTAILAGGRDTLKAMTSEHHIEVLALGRGGDIWATPAFRA